MPGGFNGLGRPVARRMGRAGAWCAWGDFAQARAKGLLPAPDAPPNVGTSDKGATKARIEAWPVNGVPEAYFLL